MATKTKCVKEGSQLIIETEVIFDRLLGYYLASSLGDGYVRVTFTYMTGIWRLNFQFEGYAWPGTTERLISWSLVYIRYAGVDLFSRFPCNNVHVLCVRYTAHSHVDSATRQLYCLFAWISNIRQQVCMMQIRSIEVVYDRTLPRRFMTALMQNDTHPIYFCSFIYQLIYHIKK